MYNKHFGFLESPFTVTPDPRLFYTNPVYKEALAALNHGISGKKGFIVITGEVGTGKTTLLRKLMRFLEGTIHSVFIFNTHLDFNDLLRLILRDLGLSTEKRETVTMSEELNRYLIEQVNKGHIVSVLIDEAQNLSNEALEGLRLLSNLETDNEKLLQIVLMGQPELERKLDQPELRQLKGRVALHCQLAPLEEKEVGPYIDFRLRAAGYQGKDLFDPEAIERIALYSGGIPRVINIICDNALVNAYGASQKSVGRELIDEVSRDLRLKPERDVVTRNVPVAMPPPLTDSKYEVAKTAPAYRPKRQSTRATLQSPRRLSLRPSRATGIWIGGALALLLVVLGTFSSPNVTLNIKNSLGTLFENIEPTASLEKSLPSSVETMNKPKVASKDALPNKDARGVSATADNPTAQGLKEGTIAAKAKQSQFPRRPIERKESSLGTFEVVSPSLVRKTPNPDAEIIATLQPRRELKVVSATGNYFRVQSTDGETIRGYVHREDAFLEKKIEAPRETRRQENEILFLSRPALYQVVRNTNLETKENGAKVFIPKGTRVYVAGFNRKHNAFVVSHSGNPDGFIPGRNLERLRGEPAMAVSSPVPSGITRRSDDRTEDRSG